MFRPPSLKILGICALALALAAAPGMARADFELLLYDNLGNSALVHDNGAGDSNPLTGAITFSGSIGNFVVNVTTGTSKPLIGGPNNAQMDLNSINVTSTSGGTMTIVLADTSFTSPSGPATLTSSVGGTLSTGANSMTFQSWMNNSNLSPLPNTTFVLPPGSISPGQLGPFSPVAFSGSSSTSVTTSGNFSIFSEAVLTMAASSNTSFDGEASVVSPAPAALLIALTGLPVLGLGWWRARRPANI
jgi:hypothetical protein